MDSETPGKALVREHRQIDEGIESFLSGGAADYGDTDVLTLAMKTLRRHIYLEEEHLFPHLCEAGLVAPVYVMVREHGEMWETLATLEAALDEHADAGSVLEVCRELVAQLEAHNSKEEVILYPQADRVLDATTSAALRSLLTSPSMPEGWTCQGARG